MTTHHSPLATRHSRYEPLKPFPARGLGAVLLALLAGGVAVTLSPWRISFADRPLHDSSDADLYLAEVQRMREGENYYAVARDELTTRGFPTGSVFNWRTPLPMAALAKLPDPVIGKWMLCAAATLLVLAGVWLVRREGTTLEALLAGLLLAGTIVPVFYGHNYVLPGLWAGVLIGLSVVCFGLGRSKGGVALGVAAAFLRDLAAGYVLLMAGWCVVRRRWAEACQWGLGLAAYAAFFLYHASAVSVWTDSGDPVDSAHWLQLGGPAFVIACSQFAAFLLVLPQWVAAGFLWTALIGVAGWKSEAGTRCGIALGGYCIVFLFVGRDANQMWGMLIAPLLCLGAAKSPTAFFDLWRATRRSMR